jgi:GntR family transcriptional regulator
VTQTAEQLRRLIDEDFAQAQHLPPEAELAARLGISRATLREAIGVLWNQGLVQKKWGVGTVIVRKGADRRSNEHLLLPLLQIGSTPQQIRDGGAVPGMRHVSITAGFADDRAASLLDIDVGTAIWVVDRVHTADGVPLLRATDLLPQVINGQFLDATRFNAIDNPLLDMLRDAVGCVIDRVEGTLSAVVADADLAGSLDVPKGAPLLRAEQTNYSKDGATVMVGSVWHRADMMDFRYTRTRDGVGSLQTMPSPKPALTAPERKSSPKPRKKALATGAPPSQLT